MHKYLAKLEHYIDLVIPYILVVLLAVIIIELSYPQSTEEYPILNYIDWGIIFVFVIDLMFKFHHSATIPYFFKHYWLDIIAVFPFFLFFRLFEVVGATSDLIKEGQSIVHVTSNVEKEVSVVSKVTRAEQFARFLRPFFGWTRFGEVAHFYQKPADRS
jgi:hypothetical protein